jgi:hypothetical protein
MCGFSEGGRLREKKRSARCQRVSATGRTWERWPTVPEAGFYENAKSRQGIRSRPTGGMADRLCSGDALRQYRLLRTRRPLNSREAELAAHQRRTDPHGHSPRSENLKVNRKTRHPSPHWHEPGRKHPLEKAGKAAEGILGALAGTIAPGPRGCQALFWGVCGTYGSTDGTNNGDDEQKGPEREPHRTPPLRDSRNRHEEKPDWPRIRQRWVRRLLGDLGRKRQFRAVPAHKRGRADAFRLSQAGGISTAATVMVFEKYRSQMGRSQTIRPTR